MNQSDLLVRQIRFKFLCRTRMLSFSSRPHSALLCSVAEAHFSSFGYPRHRSRRRLLQLPIIFLTLKSFSHFLIILFRTSASKSSALILFSATPCSIAFVPTATASRTYISCSSMLGIMATSLIPCSSA